VVAFHWPTLAFSYSLRSCGPGERVVPREDRVGVVLDDVLDLVDVGVGDRQDRLDVVDVGGRSLGEDVVGEAVAQVFFENLPTLVLGPRR
jgi:hypothetical protein